MSGKVEEMLNGLQKVLAEGMESIIEVPSYDMANHIARRIRLRFVTVTTKVRRNPTTKVYDVTVTPKGSK